MVLAIFLLEMKMAKQKLSQTLMVSELSTKKDDVLKTAYGEESDISFKLPRIRMFQSVFHIESLDPIRQTLLILLIQYLDYIFMIILQQNMLAFMIF